MAIDYFIKWIEAELLTKITEVTVKDFIWKSIIYHFGLPRILIMENNHQISNAKLAKFCKDMGNSYYFTSVSHPQAM